MKERIEELYEKFKKDNPRDWVLKSNNPSLQGWYDGYEQAIKEVLRLYE